MFTLRCTQKLLGRMRLTPADLKGVETQEPTTALGDWYAHLLLIQRQHLVLLVSDRSRLCVLTTARDIDRLTQRFDSALFDLLRAINISEEAIALEQREMGQMCYGLTTERPNGRSVLGSIKDYANVLKYGDMMERSLFDWNLYFSDWICGPLDYQHPADVARQLLEAAVPSHAEDGLTSVP